MCSLTNFDAVVAEKVSRQDHLAETEAWTEGGEEGDWRNGEAIDEEDCQKRVNETKVEDWDCQCTNGERGDNHIG